MPVRFQMGFPGGSDGKESVCNEGDPGLIPVLGRSSGEGNSTPSNILALRIIWTEESGGLQSMGLQRVRHDRVTNTFTLSRLQMTGGKPLASRWGGGSIKLQITVKTVVGVTEWNIGLKIQEKNGIWWKVKVCVYCIRYTHRTWIQNT